MELLKYEGENNLEAEILLALKKYRLGKAKENNLQVYYIFDNKQLEMLLKVKPRTKDEFIYETGLGQNKYNLYGEDIINIIKECFEK